MAGELYELGLFTKVILSSLTCTVFSEPGFIKTYFWEMLVYDAAGRDWK